jgi:hypothetical protein
MSFNLTGNKVSSTFGNLVQIRSGSLYDGLGNPVSIAVESYVIYSFSHLALDPVDFATYYIGNIPTLEPFGSSTPASRVLMQFTGQITEVSIMSYCQQVLGTGESQTFQIKNVTKGVTRLITNTYSNTQVSQLDNFVLVTPLDVDDGDSVEIIWINPSYAVAHENLIHHFNAKLVID